MKSISYRPAISFRPAFVTAILCIWGLSCAKIDEPQELITYPLPELLDSTVVARLTERHETEHYIFYYAPGDTVEFDRCETYASWGLDYLDISLPKKIQYLKFRSFEEMGEALPSPAGGWAFSEEVAYATMWKWHNHECMHILAHWWSNNNWPPSFFTEGMAVAHEYDPYNNDWISRWNRDDIRDPWIDIVQELHAEGKLYPISDILESETFWEHQSGETERIAYPQAGMFVDYLIREYGLEKFRELYSSLGYADSLALIREQIVTSYSISLEQLEMDWLQTL